MKIARLAAHATRVLGLSVVVALASGIAHAQVSLTKHNLGATNRDLVNNNNFSGTDQVCVFCHTPHGANTSLSGSSSNPGAPLWNRAAPTNAVYTTYQTTATLDGQVLSTLGNVSLACLSCHDGTQALNSLLNDPGSGTAIAGGTFLSGSWTPGSTGTLFGATLTTAKLQGIVQLAGAVAGTTDLSNDHPIGIPYCGGFSSGTTCVDSGFRAVTSTSGKYYVDVGTLNSTTGAVEPGDGSYQKSDLPLYVRTFSAGNLPSVECGSCHDPHMAKNSVSGTGANEVNFMRQPLSGSKICLSCHVK